MTFTFTPMLAEDSHALFGQPWYALFAILIGVAAVLFGVAAVGRWLASTHPTPPAPAPTAPAATSIPSALMTTPGAAQPTATPSTEVFAVIAAAVVATLGSRARIAAINPLVSTNKPAIDTSHLQWSMEGRRQIYSSHKVR